MGGWLRAGAMALLVAGCSTGSPVAPPDITSMLNFAAYPGATLVEEHVNDPGPIPWPNAGGYATRTYETPDAPEKVRTHYETLATTHGWTVEGPSPPPSAQPQTPIFFMLRRQRFAIAVDLRKSDFSYDYPAPSPDPNAKTHIQVSASNRNN